MCFANWNESDFFFRFDIAFSLSESCGGIVDVSSLFCHDS